MEFQGAREKKELSNILSKCSYGIKEKLMQGAYQAE